MRGEIHKEGCRVGGKKGICGWRTGKVDVKKDRSRFVPGHNDTDQEKSDATTL